MGTFKQVDSGDARERVVAERYLFKLCGSSQPSIVQGSDGAFYVVKLHGFPGHQGLANEVAGTELIRSVGLPAPDWAPIEVSDDFLKENPGLWFSNGNHSIRPPAGLHFGSRLIEGPDDQRTYQMIPHSWIERIENRADFLGMLALDLWTNHCDRRQAVFLSDARRLYARFIDNDFMFGGKSGTDTTCPRRAMVYDLGIYQGLWSEKAVQQWLQKFEGVDENRIWRLVAGIPRAWADEKIRLHIFDQLRARRQMLPRLLNEARSALDSGYSLRCTRPRNATEPGNFRPSALLPPSSGSGGSSCSGSKRRKGLADMDPSELERTAGRGRPNLHFGVNG